MLKLTYHQKNNTYVTVLGDPEGIRDLLWQLTRNYQCDDGTAIVNIEVTNLDGVKIDLKEFKQNPHEWGTSLSYID